MKQGHLRQSCPGLRQGAVCLCLGVLLPATPAFGRKHAPPSKPPQGVLRVTTQLVQVNVIVKDRHGKLVPGLTRDAFKVLDDGKPQKISIFRVEETGPPAAPTAQLPPDTFSNIPERESGAVAAVTVILLDGLNTPWVNQASARMQVIQFLRQLQPGDRVALYALGSQLQVLHDFTSDASALVAALSHFRGRIASELEASEPDNLDSSDGGSRARAEAAALQQWLSDRKQFMADYYMNRRVQMTVAALVAIAGHLEGLPGRKNLIWVSGGFPLLNGLDQILQPGGFNHLRSYAPEISRAARALNNVNLAVYPVDARGLMVMPTFSAARRNAPGRTFPDLTKNFFTMDEIAERTGGRAFYNSNDIRGAIRSVVDDSRLTYVLGYYPENQKWDGEYRKIKVEVSRSGLQLQYRRGYVAAEEPPSAPQGGDALADAVFSPLDATAVGFAVRATSEQAQPGGPPAVRMVSRIDAHDVTLTPDGNTWTGSVTLAVVELDPRGANLKGKTYTLNMKLQPETRRKFLASGIVVTGVFPIVPGGERMRVVVRDDPSGQMGSITFPLDRVLARPTR